MRMGGGEEEAEKEKERTKGERGEETKGAGEKTWEMPCCWLCSWRRELEAKAYREPLDKKTHASFKCLGGTQLWLHLVSPRSDLQNSGLCLVQSHCALIVYDNIPGKLRWAHMLSFRFTRKNDQLDLTKQLMEVVLCL